MKAVTARELAAWLSDPGRSPPRLLDVRETWEFELCRIEGSISMPMQQVPARHGDMAPGVETVVICHHGVRSMQVGLFLEHQGFARVINLTGGVAAWARDVDPAMPTY